MLRGLQNYEMKDLKLAKTLPYKNIHMYMYVWTFQKQSMFDIVTHLKWQGWGSDQEDYQ